MTNHTNFDNGVVYSTPKEDKTNIKKEYQPNKKYQYNKDKKRERKHSEDNEDDDKQDVEYDSDGFEIITEKKSDNKKKNFKKREYDNNGERKKFNKKDQEDKNIKKDVPAEEKPKEKTVVSNLGKVAVLDVQIYIISSSFIFKIFLQYKKLFIKFFRIHKQPA